MIEHLRNQIIELMNLKDENFNKYSIINDILNNNNCFKEMDIDTAISILKDIGYNYEDSLRIYNYMIDINNI